MHPVLDRLPTGATAAVLLALPIAVPSAAALWLKWTSSRHTSSFAGIVQLAKRDEDDPSTPPLPLTLPLLVKEDPTSWVLSFERVASKSHMSLETNLDGSSSSSKREIVQSLDDGLMSAIIKTYSRAAQIAFSWTPQGLLIRSVMKDPEVRRTFDTDFIRQLDFNIGDVANAVYKVVYKGEGTLPGSERVELNIEAPPSFDEPVQQGIIVTQIERVYDEGAAFQGLNFVNETWMWRRAGEKASLLESAAGKWYHGKVVGLLVIKGMKAVSRMLLQA